MNRLLSVVIILVLLVTVFSPAIEASVVYGPEKFDRNTGAPGAVTSQFQVSDPHGNYSLYVRNGDLNGGGDVTNGASSAIVRLNGNTLFSAKDFNQNTYLLKKNVTAQDVNDLQVEVRSIPGSYITAWLEDESPDIVILSPWEDTVSEGKVLLAGYTTDRNITSINLKLNNDSASTAIPVTDGNFSTEVQISGPVKITLSVVDSTGTLRTASLCLDGDTLVEKYERQYGFDPLDPDSDSSLTAVSEADNGIMDSFEILGGQNADNTRLPALVKARTGADPLKDDTDGDGLTDYYEVMKLGPYADVRYVDWDNDGISDAAEDPDEDSLANLEEQAFGTNPLIADTDRDGLTDGLEVMTFSSSPFLGDTDSDSLEDDSEFRLGTDPNDPDSNHNGILDGNEVYTTAGRNDSLGVTVTIMGNGDVAKSLVIGCEKSPVYTGIPALVSPAVKLEADKPFDNATITLTYDACKVNDTANLSLYYFNESLGTFLPVASTVDPIKHTVTGTTNHFSLYTIFHVPTWNALFTSEMSSGRGGSTDVMFVDVMFTIDSSGSMSWNDPNGYRKTAAKNFVGALVPGDRAGVVDFDSYASVKQPLTSNFSDVNRSIDRLDASGGTNIGAGVSAANSHLIANGNKSHAWLMILLTDGQGSYSSYYTQQAKANNITIYTIGLGSSVDSNLLTQIATQTGGKYFSVSSADQLPQVFRNISEEIEPIDSDGDGLSDTLETTGFRDGCGNVYHTNPNDPDSDDDGLPDGEEAGELTTAPDGKTYYYCLTSPTSSDTDCDELGDFDEVMAYDTDPRGWDTDSDWLPDGYEVNIGTNPNSGDTDGDGYPDFFEVASQTQPMMNGWFNPLVKDISLETRALEYSLGMVAGEWAYQGHDNTYFLLGWMTPGLIPVVSDLTDVRDFFAAVYHMDAASIAMNGATVIIDIASDLGYLSVIGAAPGYLASTISSEVKICGKFLASHPHMINTVLPFVMTLYTKLDNNIGKAVATAIEEMTRAGKDGSGIYNSLKGRGISDAKFVEWCSKGVVEHADLLTRQGSEQADIDKVIGIFEKNGRIAADFDNVERIGKTSDPGKIYWLEKGKSSYGSDHIHYRHIAGTDTGRRETTFWPAGYYIQRLGKTTPGNMNVFNVKEMIEKSVKYGKQPDPNDPGKFVLELCPEQYGIKEIVTIVGDDGRIVTSWPSKGSNVCHYDEIKRVWSESWGV
ncbi:VWA domain-containing protein [Methanocella sp. MCL-LM]|uniref:VWA domain-containing protein n=1 Tax=Methanocella sp. MCL-LM TaxID=3412035 RepID=UPI003C72D1F3